MRLWLIEQEANSEYDTYDSAVVVAESAGAAVLIYPDPYGYGAKWDGAQWRHQDGRPYCSHSWTTPDNVTATFVGEAADGLGAGHVVCASFNAG